jgi:ABC-2 type transport system permease protein
MMISTYSRYELLRVVRNKRFFLFSIGFPVVLYVVIAGPQKNDRNFGGSGVPAALYYMVGMVAFGTMTAMLSSGARIANERQVGWTRQLRISPLKPRSYFRTKLVTAYMMASLTIAVLYGVGAAFGVRIPAGRWVEMTLLILAGLVPFGAAGIVLGHVLTPDSIGPVMGGGTALLALLGGVWFPIEKGTVVYGVARMLPTFWLVRAGHVGSGGRGWGPLGFAVVAGWTVVFTILAVWVYRRDSGRA